MKNKIMKRWVKALRSGKFKQGRNTLKQLTRDGGAKHCCLGVLCELYNQDRKKNHKKMIDTKINNWDTNFKYGVIEFDGYSGLLPKEVKEWAGLTHCTGEFLEYADCSFPVTKAKYYSLADMNDKGVTFKTIADTIEKQWENL